MRTDNNQLHYTGRIGQFFIYLNKQFRLFVLQSDWKVLPMAAIIAAMVSIAVGRGLFVSMEGTFQGTFALTCVCIWNGFFNSIQSICKERAIIKREHRAGMHITSYVCAHLVYQFILCILQVAITITVLGVTGVKYPETGVLFGFIPEMFISMLLITYAADVCALMVSSIVKTSTAAMTVMPFILIVQLVLSGFIALPAALSDATSLMLSKWGVMSMCVISDYNSLPAVMIWNKMVASGDRIDLGGGISMGQLLGIVEEQGMRDTILQKLGEANAREDFAANLTNLVNSWGHLIAFTVVYAVIAVVFLEFIDKDSR